MKKYIIKRLGQAAITIILISVFAYLLMYIVPGDPVYAILGSDITREQYEKQTEELLEPIVAEQGFELVDVEYVKEAGNWYLRAYIDKPGGITVDDCEVVSRRFSDILDEKDYIEDSYIFEVSSPGLGRPLKKEKDFIRSVGQEVEIRTYRAINRQKEFVGILKEFDQNTVTISYEDDSTQTFEKSEIALIRLALDF